MSNAVSDDAAVVGEPASQPHQAAVVGEPPNNMAPVLGEPVLLPNGISSDQAPSSALAPDNEPAMNGIREENASVSESSDALASSATSNVDEPITSEHEGTHASAPGIAIAPRSSPETQEMNAGPASVEISSEVAATPAVDDPSQRPPESENPTVGPTSVESPSEGEATPGLDARSPPSPPESEIPTDNPSSFLDHHDPQESDVKSADDVEGAAASNIPHEGGDQTVSTADEKEVASASELVPPSPVANAEVAGGSSTEPCNEPDVEWKESPAAVGADDKHIDAATGKAELVQPESRKTSKNFDLDGVGTEGTAEAVSDAYVKGIEEKNMEEGASSSHAEHEDNREVPVIEGAPEGEPDAKEGASLPSNVVSRDAVLPGAVTSEDISMRDGADVEVLRDSSHTQFDKDVSVDQPGPPSIPVEESTRAQSSADEVSLGEDGIKKSEDVVHSSREKPSMKVEKASSHFKLPVILTVVVAAVGVVAVSIGRLRQ